MIAARKMFPRLYVVRHGETAWSLSDRHTGSTDLPLTVHGQEAARALGQCIRRTTFTHVISSPLQRARRTCELARPDLRAEIESDLSEWNYGDYEGKHSDDIRKERPGWNVFNDGCPGGETPEQIAARADRLIARLDALTGNIALFTHGQFACVLAARWIASRVSEAVHFSLDTASLSILGESPSHPDMRVITLWNFTPASSRSGFELSL
jgi:broad specificity phosphatase PhoE